MSDINKLSKTVPMTEAELIIDVKGEVTNKRFIGEFTCRIPRKKETCLIDKHRAFLNGPQPDQLNADTLKFHHMIAYLRYTIDDKNCPKWWKESDLGYELYDNNVVEDIYNKVLDFEVSWLKLVWGEEFHKKFGDKKEAEGSNGEEAAQEEKAG